MGWDAFGLLAEGQPRHGYENDPADFTAENIANQASNQRCFESCSYDWDREVNTMTLNYYKWTQWIFTKLYERLGL